MGGGAPSEAVGEKKKTKPLKPEIPKDSNEVTRIRDESSQLKGKGSSSSKKNKKKNICQAVPAAKESSLLDSKPAVKKDHPKVVSESLKKEHGKKAKIPEMNCCVPNICVSDDRHLQAQAVSDGHTTKPGHHKSTMLNFSKLGKFGSAPAVIKLLHPRVAGPSVVKCVPKHILVKGKPDSPITQGHVKEIRPGSPPNQWLGQISSIPFPWPQTLSCPQYLMLNKNNEIRPAFFLPPEAPSGVPGGALAYNVLSFQQASPDPGNQGHKTDSSAPVHGPFPYIHPPGTQRHTLNPVPADKCHPHSSPLANLADTDKVPHPQTNKCQPQGWTASPQPIHAATDKGHSQGGENSPLACQPTFFSPTYIAVGKMAQVKKPWKTNDGGEAFSGTFVKGVTHQGEKN
ncbi:uncharacterized protein LOC121313923 [Polyodon spathula]|uniref:uncharacterized protein LOC121313923 n=1 Tax=Polyodon spathula TaxID=7913 RepID=UPI001B7E215E|nr:uncharacterized protein LOC121313923 [Polyodon spathula]